MISTIAKVFSNHKYLRVAQISDVHMIDECKIHVYLYKCICPNKHYPILQTKTYWQLEEFPEVRLARANVAASFTSPLSEPHSLIRGCMPSIQHTKRRENNM